MNSPINSLCGQISHAFENPNGSALPRLKEVVSAGLLDPGIDLVQDGAMRMPCVSRASASEPATIALHVHYLQTLWAFIYAFFVIYEEGVQRPLMNKAFDGSIDYRPPLLLRAGQLLAWIATDDSAWPDNLPSPTYSEAGVEKEFADKANTIFIYAVAFLLHHEFAHVALGHLGVVNAMQNDADKKQLEQEADEFAFSALILQSDDEAHRRSKGWSVLAPVLLSLYLTRDCTFLFSTTHPFVHHRVDAMLKRLNFKQRDSQDYFTYLCTIIAKYAADKLVGEKGQRTFETAEGALRTNLDELDTLQG